MNKIEITILDRPTAADKKTAVFPSRRVRKLGRRRTGAFIEFYDLGQVTHNLTDFVDHPILKVPTYSVEMHGDAPLSVQGTALFDIEQFTTADYQAFTDLLFDYPVEEWYQRYKRLDYEAPLDTIGLYAYTDYPSRLKINNNNGRQVVVMRPGPEQSPPLESNVDAVEIDALLHTDPPSYAKAVLNACGLAWWNSPKMPVRGLRFIETGPDDGSYFPLSTDDKVSFKVTATNDPNAADVGVITPTGLTRLFLVPQIFCWAAVATSSDRLSRYILGPVYQVMPRQMWPRYVDRTWTHTYDYFTVGSPTPLYQGVIDDPDDRKKEFFEYQMARSGMIASSFTRASLSDPFENGVFTDGQLPSSWPSNAISYVSQGFTNLVDEAAFDAGSTGNPYRGDVSFKSGLEIQFFEMSDPFLCAVIQKGSNFYYVWMLDSAVNYTSEQGNKFRLTLRQDFLGSHTLFDDAGVFS